MRRLIQFQLITSANPILFGMLPLQAQLRDGAILVNGNLR